jgi:hypothetical protein
MTGWVGMSIASSASAAEPQVPEIFGGQFGQDLRHGRSAVKAEWLSRVAPDRAASTHPTSTAAEFCLASTSQTA